MAEASSQMAGEFASTLDADQLAVALGGHGICVQVRESSHFEGGRYIRLFDGATHFTLERISGEYLARGDASSVEQMCQTTSTVSSALAALDIRHRFEVYSPDSQLVHYLHHRWPPTSSAELPLKVVVA